MTKLLLFVGWAAVAVLGQAPPPPQAPLEIVSVSCPGTAECELGDTVRIEFKNLKEWCDVPDHDPKALDLILDGRLLPGVHPVAPAPCGNVLGFELERLEDPDDTGKANRETWNVLLRRAHSAHKDFQVSVGLESAAGKQAIISNAKALKVRVFPWYKWVIYPFLAALLAGFLVLAAKSNILRDPADPGVRRTFSLARCQMAWWFFLIVCAYHYIWMVTGDRDSLTPGVLMLMGISAATGLSATLIGNRPKPAQPDANARPPSGFQRFIVEILSDDDGVSFHRFQLAAWTIVLGFVFAISVYKTLAMPDFSATLLGLMGISSGTYIGFKIPDSPKPPETPPDRP